MTKLQRLKTHLVHLLSESSTWRSIIFFSSLACGYSLNWPEEHQLFVATSAAYAVGLLFKDKTE